MKIPQEINLRFTAREAAAVLAALDLYFFNKMPSYLILSSRMKIMEAQFPDETSRKIMQERMDQLHKNMYGKTY